MADSSLSTAQQKDFQRLCGLMIPASAEFGVPGADDPRIFADMMATLGRDTGDVRLALDQLATLAGGDFSALPEARAETIAAELQNAGGRAVSTLNRVVLQCYYRDDRVVVSLGFEARPPFPLGNKLEQGDWSLLDPVKARPKMWRDAP